MRLVATTIASTSDKLKRRFHTLLITGVIATRPAGWSPVSSILSRSHVPMTVRLARHLFLTAKPAPARAGSTYAEPAPPPRHHANRRASGRASDRGGSEKALLAGFPPRGNPDNSNPGERQARLFKNLPHPVERSSPGQATNPLLEI